MTYLILNTSFGHSEVTSTVLESPGKPVTGSPPILKGCHNAWIDGSPSIRKL